MSAIILNSQFHWKTWLHVIVTLTLNFNCYECSLTLNFNSYECSLFPTNKESVPAPSRALFLEISGSIDSPWPQKRIEEPQKNNRQHHHLSLTCPWFLDQNQSIAGRSPRWKFQFHVLSESYKNGRDWFAFSDGHCSLYTTHSSDLGVALLFLRKLAPLGQRFCSKW